MPWFDAYTYEGSKVNAKGLFCVDTAFPSLSKVTPYLTENFQGVWKVEKKWKASNLVLDITGIITGPMRLPILGPLDPRPDYSSIFHILNFHKGWYKLFY